jgi:hypothetical protein
MNRFLSQRAGLVLTFSLVIVAPAALVLVPGALQAQTIISGDIAGTVTDPSGAAVPGATVTATDTATGTVKVVKTRRRWSLSSVIAATWRLHPIRRRRRL